MRKRVSLVLTWWTPDVQLELRQYNNDSIQSNKIPILNLPRFFPRRVGDEKERQF